MAQETRHKQIIALVAERGFVTIDDLAQHFQVTPQTIRRDINQLDQEKLLQRYHGGAGIPSSTLNTAYSDRKIQNLEEKTRIGEAIASKIPDHSSMFINIGTTTETIAKALLKHHGLTIITNNLHVASILSSKEDFNVIIAGGAVRNRDGGIIGEATVDFVKQFKVDFAIIGISGIDDDGELLDFDYQEVRVAQAIIENARQVFLAADHSKFGRNAMIRLGNISQASHLFTGQTPPKKISGILAEHGVELTVTH
ncbi:DeoR/GlpR family transcriptional regulator [Alkalimarinus alittae]|uniref:DeoR/GlpR family transcriptional regulator n=1 Tax=Alkalimarinus alittae TaxID=2961619 RepID=A0ABY6MZL0_9ALTE|nr:DeoR/GlpR family transcriptional regulator [Alkalimarinus alittae]UZE95259.1 DeoR/GlpR family transcriptional regulator [Alkalimarinus alittae]